MADFGTTLRVPTNTLYNPLTSGMGGAPGYFRANPVDTTPTPPGVLNQPAYNPDYSSLIQNDPGLVALRNALSAQGISNAAQRAQATQRALIQYGIVPDFTQAGSKLGLSPDAVSMLSQDVTPDVTALANQNTANGLSTEARLNQAHSQAVTALRNALAARGALSSGEANYQLNNQEQNFQQAQQDTVGKLLDAITGYQGAYLQGQQAAQNQLATEVGNAAQRQQNNPGNQPTPAQTFTYDAGSGKYVGAGGTYTPHQTSDGSWVVVNDNSGIAYTVKPDGTLGEPTTYTPPPPSGSSNTNSGTQTTTPTTPDARGGTFRMASMV